MRAMYGQPFQFPPAYGPPLGTYYGLDWHFALQQPVGLISPPATPPRDPVLPFGGGRFLPRPVPPRPPPFAHHAELLASLAPRLPSSTHQTPISTIPRDEPPKPKPAGIKKRKADAGTAKRAGREALPLPKDPPLKPLVWSATRQELCEGSGYFKSYQGGTYAVPILDGQQKVPVWLIDSTTSLNNADIFTGRIIISHTGGNFDPASGTMKSSQAETDPGRRLFLDALRNKTPVLVICGTKYESILDWRRLETGNKERLTLGENNEAREPRYVVLGWGKISECWIEPEPLIAEGRLPTKTGRRQNRESVRPLKKAKVEAGLGFIKSELLPGIEATGLVSQQDLEDLDGLGPGEPPNDDEPETVDAAEPPRDSIANPSSSEPRIALRYKFRIEFVQTGSPETDRSVAGRWWPHLILQRHGLTSNTKYLSDAPGDNVKNESSFGEPANLAELPRLSYTLSDESTPCKLPDALPLTWNPAWEPYLTTSTRPSEQCHLCTEVFVQRWDEGWMCGNVKCSAFWKVGLACSDPLSLYLSPCEPHTTPFQQIRTIDTSTNPPSFRLDPPPAQLHYHPTFLLPTLPVDPDFKPPFKIAPEPAPQMSSPSTFERTSYHCNLCGRISTSREWTGWKCLSCGAAVNVQRSIVDKPLQWSGSGKLHEHGYLGQVDSKHVTSIEMRSLADGRAETVYTFASGCAVIHRRVVTEQHEVLMRADNTFRELQIQASRAAEGQNGIGFERRVLKQSPLGRGTVTSHYSVNFGGGVMRVHWAAVFDEWSQIALSPHRGLRPLPLHAGSTVPPKRHPYPRLSFSRSRAQYHVQRSPDRAIRQEFENGLARRRGTGSARDDWHVVLRIALRDVV